MLKCPKCGGELTPAEIKSLWSAYTNSIITDKKKKASAENGKKGGRPKKKPEVS